MLEARIQYSAMVLILEARVNEDGDGAVWDLFCTYGPPYAKDKERLWSSLVNRVNATDFHWVVI